MSTISTTITHGITIGSGTYASPLTIASSGAVEASSTPAIFGSGSPATIVNTGLILGSSVGVDLATGTGGSTLTNAGTISGGSSSGTAVEFAGGNNLLIVDPGAVFIGIVDGGTGGNTIELASTSSIGTMSGQYNGFQTIIVDAGARWMLNGGGNLGAGITLGVLGTLTNSGTLSNAGAIELSASGGTLVNSGSFQNSGYLGVTAGTLANSGQLSGTGTVNVTGGLLSNTGGVDNLSTLSLSGGVLSIGSTTSLTVSNFGFTGGTLAGAGTLVNTGDMTLGQGPTIDGVLDNQGAIAFTGGVLAGTGTLINDTTGSFTDESSSGNPGTLGVSIVNLGTFNTTASTDESASNIANSGTLNVTTGATLSATSLSVTGGTMSEAGGSLTTNTLSVTGGTVSVTGGTLTDTGTLLVGSAGILLESGTGRLIVGGSLVNSGSIDGIVTLSGGGYLNNNATGRMTSVGTAVYGTGGNLTLVNAGTISGSSGTAVQFAGGGNRVVVDPGAVFVGIVSGGSDSSNTLALGSAAGIGTLSGLGTSFANFGAVGVDTGAQWVLSGSNTMGTGVTLTDLGTLTNAGSLTGAGVLINSGSLVNSGTISSTATVTSGGVITNTASGVMQGAGTVVYGTGGASTIINSGTIAASSGPGILLDAGGTITDAGTISGSGTAISFGGSGANLLILEHGYALTGAVLGSGSAGSNTLELLGSAAAPVTGNYNGLSLSNFGTVKFAPGAANYATLKITNNAALPGTISGFAGLHDVIDLTSLSDAGNDASYSFNSVTDVLTVIGDNGSVQLQLDSGSVTRFIVGNDGSNGTSVTVVPPDTTPPVPVAASLSVAENAASTAIGIAAPSDPDNAASALTVKVTGLPSDGTVSNAGTAVTLNQVLTVAQLTALTFAPTPNTFGQSSSLTYTVADPAGNSATGNATLAIGADTTPPVPVAASLSVAENAASTAIGIAAPSDPDNAASALTVKVTGLPSDGTVSNAGTAVTLNQVLTVAQLTALTFAPTPNTFGQSSSLTYTVADPAGNSAISNATLAIGADTTPQQSPIVLNDFGWAQGWGSPDDPRIFTDVNGDGTSDYVGFGYSSTFIAYGGTFSSGGVTGPGFTSATAAVQDFGSSEGYTADVQRGAAAAGVGDGDILYGQGYAGVYWYSASGETAETDAAGNTYDVLQYQTSPNFYGNFGSQQGWTSDNGFQILKTSSTDSSASILGFGYDGIVVGPDAFATGATATNSYVIPLAVGNGSGWKQSVDVRSFTDQDGKAIDLNGDGVADFVGMGPNGLVYAYGSESGGSYTLGTLQTAHIDGGSTDLGEAQGWTDATTARDIVYDSKTGYDDIIAFGAAGVYVSMGQDPNTHNGEPFGQLYLAMADFGSDQGWSVDKTPRLIGDVTGGGIPDIVGFGYNDTFVAVGSRDSSGNLQFKVDSTKTIADFGSAEGWSGSAEQAVRALGTVAGTGSVNSHSDLILSGANNTQVWHFT